MVPDAWPEIRHETKSWPHGVFPTNTHPSSPWNGIFYKHIQKSDNKWKSAVGPNIFPGVTPPDSKGHSSEQSPLCCLFKDHFTCWIWHEHPLSYNSHSTPLEKGAWLAQRRGRRVVFRVAIFPVYMNAHREEENHKLTEVVLYRAHWREVRQSAYWSAPLSTVSRICIAINNSAHKWWWNRPSMLPQHLSA